MMNLVSKYELAIGQLPMEPDSNVVYFLETGYNPEFETYVRGHYAQLQRMFRNRELEFVFLPLTRKGLAPVEFEESALFYFPWLKKGQMDYLHDSFLKKADDYFKDLAQSGGVPVMTDAEGHAFKMTAFFLEKHGRPDDSIIYLFFQQLADACYKERHLKFNTSDHKYKVNYCKRYLNELLDNEDEISYSISDENPEVRFSVTIKDTTYNDFNDIDAQLKRDFARLVRTRQPWFVQEWLSKMLQEDEIISRLVITPQAKIMLPDYNDIEIILTPKEKAVFFLYLKHPEGICFKNLPDYREELSMYYRRVTRSGSPEAISAAIDNLVLSISGDADVQRSRIRNAINKAFKDRFCEQYSRYYTIEGSKGQPLKIQIPRDKVIWELDI